MVTDGNLSSLPGWVPEMVRPVIEMIDFHAPPCRDLGGTLAGRRQCEDEKVSVISNLAVGTASRLGRCCVEGLPRALSQCWVIDRVVNLVGILAKPAVYLFQRPRGAAVSYTHLTLPTKRIV